MLGRFNMALFGNAFGEAQQYAQNLIGSMISDEEKRKQEQQQRMNILLLAAAAFAVIKLRK